MTTASKRVPLYERLPEIYRIRDAEQTPPEQLRAFLTAVERALGAVDENIEALYNDLFIDTCAPWVIPYLADLVGASHLAGDPRTLRADVADTIALRRRKGTLGALEQLAANLTGWPCRCVELFPNLAWTQHLNHQRPDAGGDAPYGAPDLTRFAVRRGGTVPIRDPAMLSLLGTPFDPFAYTADVKRADDGKRHVNLPNLAVFLWRLAAYRIAVSIPRARSSPSVGPPFAVGFDLEPLGRAVRLFNTYRDPPPDATGAIDTLTEPDAVPGPMLDARLTSGSEAGKPGAYVRVDLFDDSTMPPTGLDVADVGLQLYLPQNPFAGVDWTFRGDNLCAWEEGLRRPLAEHEIVIDPDIGRVIFGAASTAERDALVDTGGGSPRARIYVGFTYGAVGPVGAHPVSRDATPTQFQGEPVELRPVAGLGGTSLQTALGDLHEAPTPVIVEIGDSLVHPLDLTLIADGVTENGLAALRLNRSLVIRAASGHRPIIELSSPLAFRPTIPDAVAVARLTVRLEGVFVTRSDAFTGPLIGRAAVARLELDGCTLDPGGYRQRDDTRAPLATAIALGNDYGFAAAADEDAFEPTPDLVLRRTVSGALRIDDGYRLIVEASIVEAGDDLAISSVDAPETGWGAPLDVRGATFFGRVRMAEGSGSGGVFVHRLEVWNHQRGCIKHSYFSGDADRLPPHHACVMGTDAKLDFVSAWFGDPGYGQLALRADYRIRTRGPGDDAMGAFGFLLEAHRWTNFSVRLREFMPVGVRPLLLPVT